MKFRVSFILTYRKGDTVLLLKTLIKNQFLGKVWCPMCVLSEHSFLGEQVEFQTLDPK